MDNQFNPGLQQMIDVWEAVKNGETLEGDEARLAAVMSEHEEYFTVWDKLDSYVSPDPGSGEVSPVAHVAFHQIIENQIAGGEPKEVTKVVERLARKYGRHEAIHRVASVMADEFYYLMRDHRPFNTVRYVRNISKLR